MELGYIISSEISNIKNNISCVNEHLNKNIETMNSWINTYNLKFTQIFIQIDDAKGEIKTNSEILSDIEDKINSINIKLIAINNRLSCFEERFINCNKRICLLEKKFNII